MLHRNCKAGHHGYTLRLLTSNKQVTTLFQEASYGAIYRVARCLTILYDSILSISKGLYYDDEYTLLDGDKTASVQPSFGVKQGCPLSPLAVAIYLNDIDSAAPGVEVVLTGTPYFWVTHARR